jgi:hypothetical protein
MSYPPQAAEEVDFDESALLRMQGCTVPLQEIAASFASLKAGEAEASLWECDLMTGMMGWCSCCVDHQRSFSLRIFDPFSSFLPFQFFFHLLILMMIMMPWKSGEHV